MSDSIYRHEAIKTITSYNGVVDKSVAKRLLLQMPSVEPEIIHCKDCKYYYNTNPENIPTANIICFQMHEDDYCSYAERRADEQTD